MAIDTSVTLKRLIVEFSEWATAHPMVNDFGYGQYLETFRESENKYAAVIVNSPSATSEDFFINFSWEIICLDYVLDQNDNRDRVNSDTMDILRDLENTIRYSKRWQNFSRLDGTISYQKVDEFGADKCFGWIATFTLKIKKKHGICDIKSLMPTYDFESGTVVYPSCDPVNLEINGVQSEVIPSGEDFNLIVGDTNLLPVGIYDEPTNTLTVPAAEGSPTLDISVNGTLFYNDVSTDQDVPVKNSALVNVGAKVAANWEVGDSGNTFNGVPISSIPATEDKEISVYDSVGGLVGAISTDNANILDVTIDDCTSTMNGVSITNNKAQTNKAITIRHADDSAVVVTTITDTETVFVREIPNVVVPINSSTPYKTGQTVSYVANDDGALERGNGVDFLTLSHNNPFGNTNRFTDILGTQIYADGWVIDWSTYNQVTGDFVMWFTTYEAAATWANAMAAQPYTRGAYADCYIPNESELYNLLNRGVSPSTNYAPFNLNVTLGNNGLWTSTTVPNNAAAAYYFAGSAANNTITGSAKTANQRFILMRYGNISEL